MRIAPLSESAYRTADGPLKSFLDAAVEELRQHKSWKEREPVFLDVIAMIELGFDAEGKEGLDDEEFMDSLDPAERERLERALPTLQRLVTEVDDLPVVDLRSPAAAAEAESEADEDLDGDEDDFDDDGELEFLDLLPFVVGAVLERLNEKDLTTSEQAAFYALSCHTEHVAAAQAWLEAEPKNAAAFRAFVEAKPRYAELLAMLNELDEEEEEDDTGGAVGRP